MNREKESNNAQWEAIANAYDARVGDDGNNIKILIIPLISGAF